MTIEHRVYLAGKRVACVARVLAGPVLACLFMVSAAHAAETFPSRVVQIVVPYTPGTGADILARSLGPRLAERWRVGVVTGGLPAITMREFLDLARSQPGKLYYSSPGNGGPQHLAMELLKLDAHIDLVHVPYKGSGGALADLVGGHVQAMIVSLQTAAPYVQGGKLRMLAVMSAERSPAFPEVPTLKELGLPDLEVETWYGLFAPAGTPALVVQKLNAELNALLAQPEVRELLARQGMIPAGGTPERFGDLVKRELARWSRVVAAAGIRAD